MNRELARRIAFTIGALLLFRLGTHIPVPGLIISNIPPTAGFIARISVFALGLVPYLSAAVLIRLLSVVWARLNVLERSGERGRRKISRITLALAIVIAGFQAYGLASALKGIPDIVGVPDGWFVATTMASMLGGVVVLVWLSEQITRHGIGNGLALILSVNFLVAIPPDIAGIADLLQRGAVSVNLVLGHVAFWIAAVVVMVVVERARRNVRLEFGARKLGGRLVAARGAVLPFKIANSGFLIPTIVAAWMVFLPLAFASVTLGGDHPLIAAAYQHLQVGKPGHVILVSIAVFVLAFVYTAYVVDPEHAAESLQRHGGVISGVVPGEPTAAYLDRVVSLTTVVGAVYLTVVQAIPEAFMAYGNALPYNMGGGAALIVVCTILDIQTQVRDQSLTDRGAYADENYPSGTAGVGQGDPGAADGPALRHRSALHR